jgi:hypothetical protein
MPPKGLVLALRHLEDTLDIYDTGINTLGKTLIEDCNDQTLPTLLDI